MSSEELTSSNGKCPVCNSLDLDYGNLRIGSHGNRIYWEFICGNCGHDGNEWWDLKNGQTVVKKEQIDLSQEEIEELRLE